MNLSLDRIFLLFKDWFNRFSKSIFQNFNRLLKISQIKNESSHILPILIYNRVNRGFEATYMPVKYISITAFDFPDWNGRRN